MASTDQPPPLEVNTDQLLLNNSHLRKRPDALNIRSLLVLRGGFITGNYGALSKILNLSANF
jgi:hypothetical protein